MVQMYCGCQGDVPSLFQEYLFGLLVSLILDKTRKDNQSNGGWCRVIALTLSLLIKTLTFHPTATGPDEESSTSPPLDPL